jgi:predicted TIM-barrel fold metal-dependent hydrolase
MNAIDGDSHFSEPLDLFERYTDPPYRDRTVRVARDSTTGKRALVVDGKPMLLVDVEELLGALVAYGQKEAGGNLGTFDRYLIESGRWQDMDERVRYLDREGFAAQIIYPSLGLVWEGSVQDPRLADALCRAYNTWAFELCSGHRDLLYPAAHISLRDSALAVRELERVAKLGARSIFVAAAPVDGKSFGHASLDPVWAAAQDLDLAVGIHLAGHANYTGHDWYRDEYPGFMFVTMNVIQDPRMALTTRVYDGVFERFPRLRAGTIEAMVGWVGEWLERLDYRFKYMGHTSKMKRPASEYFRRNIWIAADPEERMFPLILQFAGDERFFIGSDYPHAEGFVNPVAKVTALLGDLPPQATRRILAENARAFYGIQGGAS